MQQFNESERRKVLRENEVLDSAVDEELNEIAELAILTCNISIAIITLANSKKQWIQSRKQAEIPADFFKSWPCKEELLRHQSIIQIDTDEDERFRKLNENNYHFLACVPLIGNENELLGTFCLIGAEPGELSKHQLHVLKLLAANTVKRIKLYYSFIEQKKRNNITYQRLYQITTQSPDYIFTLDRDLRITYMNHPVDTFREGILNKDVLEFIEPEFRNEYRQACNDCLNELKIIEKEIRINTQAGKAWFSVKFCPLKNTDGIAESLLMIAKDISAAKRASDELKKQHTILYEAQKIAQTGSCEWDLETGEAKFSSQVYDILGIEKSAANNDIKDLTNRIHPDDYQHAKALTRKGIETHSQLVFEYRIITPDGQIKNIEARGCPLVVKNGRVTSALITLQDITESVNFDKKLFTAVVQSEENERARMAGELHDGVCQYLAGTKLMLNTVEKSLTSGVEEPDKQAVVEMIRYSKTSVSDALELTRQISHNLLPVSFHEKGVIQSVKEMTIRLNLAGNIQYKIVTKGKDKGLDPNVSMNIFRIIQEFIRNSQKYSEATEVDIFISINKKEVELEIRDNGIGFDLESVNKKKGVGLLSMRKRIKAIGGSFTYTTSPGNGVHLKLKMTVE